MFYTYENWNVDTLDDCHKIYAATDAIATYKLFENLSHVRVPHQINVGG